MSPVAAPDLPVTPSPSPQPQPPRQPRLPRWARVSLWTVGTLAVLALAWTLLIGSWLPGFIKPRIEAAGSDALGTPVTLDRITIAPWKLVVQLDGLRVGDAAAPLFTLASAQTQLSLQSLRQRAPVLANLTLQQPLVNVERLSADRFNFSAVLDHVKARQAAQPPAPPSPEPARFALHNIRLEGGQLNYRDAVLQTEHHVEALRIGLPFISSLPSDVETEVQPLLEATVDGSALRLDGHARPFASARPAELALNLQGVKLADWASLLRAVLPAEFAPQALQGQLDTQLAISFEARPEPAPPSLRVRGELAVSGFDLAVPTQGVTAAWQSLKLEEIDLAPLEQKHALARVVIDGLKLQLVRQKPGAVAAKSAASASASASTAAVAVAASGAASASTASAEPPAPLQWQLGEFRCNGCAVTLRDAGMEPPVQLDLADLQLGLKNLAGPATAPIAFDLATQLSAVAGSAKPSPGTLKLAGDVSGLLPGPAGAALPLVLKADVGLDAIDLRALQPYLAPHLNLTLVGAKVGTTGQLKVDAPAGAGFAPATLRVDYRGVASLAGLQTQDSVNGADFVGWRRLALDGLAVDWQGGPGGGATRADLGRISLEGLQARVILHPDAHLNLADIVKREAGAAPQSITTPREGKAPAAVAPASAPAAPAASASPLQLRWQAISVRDGAVQFTDNFVKPNYSARLTQLKGEVSALSSAAPEPAKVTISGALDDGAPLRIAGRLHPLGARLYTDIEASARGIALTRMSTYAERYAGYAIEKGSMSVTVHYKIEQGKLEAENQLFLDQLTFGNAVDSPDALKLPVRLAVALLKNSRGEIDVRMPVAGTLDDPKFSIGGIVWQVVLNLLERAVTAPFAMLFGGDSNEASYLPFAPGSAELDAAGRERLDAMAKRLLDKPTLKLEATGRADPVADGAALQTAFAAQAAASAASAASGAANGAANGAARADARSARASAGAAASAPAAAASAPVPALDAAALDRALRALADQRADRVMAYLATLLPAERVLLTRSQVTSDKPDGDQGPASRVQFDLH